MRCRVRGCERDILPHHVRRGYDLCGVHQILAEGTVLTERPAAIPAHFNDGLGEYIEDRDHLKKVRERKRKEGLIAGWD